MATPGQDRFFALGGNRVIRELVSDCAVVWVSNRDFYKEELKSGWAGTPMCTQLPCQQRNQIESAVHSCLIQLVRKRRKLHGKGVAGPSQDDW